MGSQTLPNDPAVTWFLQRYSRGVDAAFDQSGTIFPIRGDILRTSVLKHVRCDPGTDMSEIEPKPPLSTVLETALDAVVVMDREGRIIDWNATADEIFGWSRGEAIGAILGELIIPPELREAHNKGLKRFLETGVGPVLRKRIEVTALRKSGQEFPVELSITPYEETRGLVFLGFLRDITARKDAALRLEQQARHAKLLYDAISFAAGATSPEQALEICLGAVHELTGWPLGHVYLPVGDGFRPSGSVRHLVSGVGRSISGVQGGDGGDPVFGRRGASRPGLADR